MPCGDSESQDQYHELRAVLSRSPIEPHIPLVRSILWKDHRVRAVFNKLYFCPPDETFHEFLENVVIWTLGEEWFKHQIGMGAGRRHQVVDWRYAFHDLKKHGIDDEHKVDGRQVWSSTGSGPIWALITLGYDLFCLQQKSALPDFLVAKLRKHRKFQSARYEVTVAAMMARAGFEIGYLDEKVRSEKHCEFIARSPELGVEVGVEAKSKVRPGVLHEKGPRRDDPNWRGVIDLIRTAKMQKPAGLPFLMFVDLNLPPSPGVAPGEKPWVNEGLDRISVALGQPSASNPDPFALLVITNFSMHYGGVVEETPSWESAYTVAQYPETSLNSTAVRRVLEAVGRYGKVPAEV